MCRRLNDSKPVCQRFEVVYRCLCRDLRSMLHWHMNKRFYSDGLSRGWSFPTPSPSLLSVDLSSKVAQPPRAYWLFTQIGLRRRSTFKLIYSFNVVVWAFSVVVWAWVWIPYSFMQSAVRGVIIIAPSLSTSNFELDPLWDFLFLSDWRFSI